MAALRLLPNEILSIITSHLEGPKDVLHLALTNRRLAEFARLDGWKALLRGRFGLTGLDSDAPNALHGITTLYKSWGRKALLARYLEPTPTVTSLNTWQSKSWRGPRGQTMGYQPHIDSFEEIHGAWNERVEVLAWSAGTHIVIRVKKSGKSAKILWEDDQEFGHDQHTPWAFDAFRHLTSWYTYQIPESFEGRDDITDLKLLRPHQSPEDTLSLVFGTASGQLTLLSWTAEDAETFVHHYRTDGRAISSLSVSASSKPLLAATLGDSSLALYPIDHDLEHEDPIASLSEVSPMIPGALHGRLWSCNFLSNDRVAIGLGPSYEPVQIFEITTAGFLAAPLRTFNLEYKFWGGTVANNSIPRSTVYPTLPIPSMAHGGSEAGNTFLSGGYDGIIRLHDMRSNRGFETMFWDQTNDSSIYSLAAQGLERIVAGVSAHSMIKVFDIRVPGSHAYSSLSKPPRPRAKADRPDVAYNAIVERSREGPPAVSGGWNLYLNPRNPPKRNAYREDYWRNRADGPVYSLSIPSPFSPNLYTGLEGIVQSLTFHSIADPHPDPVLSQSIVRFADSGTIDVRSSYNPQGDALNLGMYEQGNEDGLGMHLLLQDGVSTGVVKNKQRQDRARSRGLDERWRDLRDENERWSRGATQQELRRGGMLNRRGRGRGRGGHGRGRGG